ncbi:MULTISPECIES: hypothetical protein [Pseudomonas]|jgi:hypothetical protein|uniref:Uncharacterized protein n=1 Tax=Pseudomonas sp. Hg7Tf TaxID=3236988 RepID=A0AB39I4S5_9PSED|nr:MULTISPECIES: hypothetical protein [Pseudomonas]KJK06301.1 hypothetical protein UB47_17320 [Pseudomonas sp. 5]MDD1979483.1 hypothetical protein [Pseudomonas putida]MDH2557688.1 hypothetical protein [Pseudomonas sp. Hg5Tf]QYX47583.1 hypothetical protein K3F43_23405 [Pseudomonas sp. S11A 273]
MQGLIINNPRLEFLRPALERWFDCIDRLNQTLGDNEAAYWHGTQANLSLLSAAAWQAELVTLQHHQSKKQRDEGEREGRCDLYIANREEAAYLQTSQRWPRIARLDLNNALQETVYAARQVAAPSQLKVAALFASPFKAGQHASPEELQDLVDDLQKHTACAIAWYFPYAYRKLHNEAGQYHPGVALLLKQA